MPLTDTAIRAAKPLDKPQKLFDGNGLFLFVSTHGTKSWRVKYTFQGREKLLTLGTYPGLSLKDAREGCATAKKQLAAGTDPSAEKKLKAKSVQTTFEGSSTFSMEFAVSQDNPPRNMSRGTTCNSLKLQNIFA